MPNSELGHLEIDGYDAEDRAASSAKDAEELSWSEYVERLQVYYDTIEKLFSPDLIVVGGGISKDSEKFLPKLTLRCPIVPAQLRNQAGIIGAAHLAVDRSTPGLTTPGPSRDEHPASAHSSVRTPGEVRGRRCTRRP